MSTNDEKEELESAEESFADLFEKSFSAQTRLEPGQKIDAKIMKISGDWIFLDTGRKGEGVLEKKELLNADGEVTVKEGETITTWFLGMVNNELRFTTKLGSGAAGKSQLEDAWRNGIPVDGHVEKEVKGGFEVKISGSVRAFCPYSQIAMRRLDNGADVIGKHLSFRITEYGENGRNLVLSHRAILEEEAAKQKEAQKEILKEGMTVRGTITSIRDFGAFVSIGSIEGLLPISELGWTRVKDVSEVLSVGQNVEVVVKQIDWEHDRISFSLKDTLADPWDNVAANYPEGSFHRGQVARLAQFGAFVTLASGIDGLIHISKLGAGKRINHPREVLKEGETVEVKVESVDRENRRLSLSLAEVSRAAEEEERTIEDFRRSSAESATKTMGTLGDLLKTKLEKTKK
ncbi:RNA-binding S1 domain protein [Geotalea daltonii FRC-32]|uniref:RNA-binding S1 domain protein n=1 Tax=Geotalea daltonii (strain DSM 22248 / JCM 15807 / FRC-32) TaxID=316067 RepID=B9M692_GEODF|nr:30S ribosomal protein S1 [Geotalea daltonii]ACM21880.1 RNA-binding S1 domain protein [Geotalea daltonii FRC-32]